VITPISIGPGSYVLTRHRGEARLGFVLPLGLLAAIVSIPPNVGYTVVFGLIAIETMGIPVPGETALIAAALLAHDGQMDIVALVAIASAAAILGDNVGFAIGRKGGRALFSRPGPFHGARLRALAYGEPFFARHGPKAVFPAAGCRGSASPAPGSPASTGCTGRRSCSGTRSEGSCGRAESGSRCTSPGTSPRT
jgi:hypothetical protein